MFGNAAHDLVDDAALHLGVSVLCDGMHPAIGRKLDAFPDETLDHRIDHIIATVDGLRGLQGEVPELLFGIGPNARFDLAKPPANFLLLGGGGLVILDLRDDLVSDLDFFAQVLEHLGRNILQLREPVEVLKALELQAQQKSSLWLRRVVLDRLGFFFGDLEIGLQLFGGVVGEKLRIGVAMNRGHATPLRQPELRATGV